MRYKRPLAWALLVILVSDLLAPTAAFALTSGPSQPEVQSFQPVSASDMVDLFSGDFSYNIPLLDVEGYPVNLFYQGGITMDQEASWVGLGWNLNPGSVNRNLRGLPDDFSGDEMTREMYMKPNRTFGATGGLGLEILGDVGDSIVDASAGATLSFNNYNGVSFEHSLNVSVSTKSTASAKGSFTAGLGLTSGSHSGLRLQPQLGIDVWAQKGENKNKLGLNVGLSIDSREGLTNMSFGATYAATKSKADADADTPGNQSATSTSKTGVTSSYDLGMPTYSPQVNMPMDNLSVSFNVALGSETWAIFPNARGGGFFSVQRLRDAFTHTPAYGYLYLDRGQDAGNAVLDFNRERGGPYSRDQAALGIAALTPDVFTVSGQGMSGSYRAFRTEVGHVYDQAVSSGGSGGSLGAEIGLGGLTHLGADVMINTANTWCGRWNLFNTVIPRARFRAPGNGTAENVFFRAANEPVVETDSSLYEAFGRNQALRPGLKRYGSFEYGVTPFLQNSQGLPMYLDGSGTTVAQIPAVARRSDREARAQVFHYITQREMSQGLGLEAPISRTGISPPQNQIGEVSVLGTGGERYVYGLPVYNIAEEEVSFSVSRLDDLGFGESLDEQELVEYDATEDSRNNRSGIDHFYSRSVTPAYAYSFLLTAIVSADYSDVDGMPGPSDGDLGNFTRFTYEQNRYNDGAVGAYPWRTPIGSNKARLERGSNATKQDDRGNYVCGEKEIWYLRTIESQNRIAVFELNDPGEEEDPEDPQGGMRLDACGVERNGQPNPARYQRYLTRISLYDKKAYRAYEAAVQQAIDEEEDPDLIPLPEAIKQVHFKYDYSLCPGIPNSGHAGAGKLTLRKIWFTHGRSHAGALAPYVFGYGDPGNEINNPSFDMGSQDRWGNLKPDQGSPLSGLFPGAGFQTISNNFFPYAEQDAAVADALAGAWNLKEVRLPSGGTIGVTYEADDYATVQDRNAMRMFRVAHIDEPDATPGAAQPVSFHFRTQTALYVALPEGLTETEAVDYVARLREGVDLLYFRAGVKYTWRSSSISPGMDLVSGYARVESVFLEDIDEEWYARVELQPVTLDEDCDGCPDDINPIYRAALEHARITYPKQLYTPLGMDDELTARDMIEWIPAQVTAIVQMITALGNFFTGPNGELLGLGGTPAKLDGPGYPLMIDGSQTWIRLNEPDARKKGGGHRVTSISVSDSWDVMESSGLSHGSNYRQEYAYGDEAGSWGVAAYEPMVGADENPFRRPVFHNVQRLLSPDDRFYQEEPFGESLFPSHMVGYARVEVKDMGSSTVPHDQGTGSVVHEFYTARDFPTITRMTTPLPRQGFSAGMYGLLSTRSVDHMHVSQGFVVETNDMHGKPKAVKVYPEPNAEGDEQQPISSVTYTYSTDELGRLKNTARTIGPDGTVATATIGRHYDLLLDMREQGTIAVSAGAQINLDAFLLGIIPIAIPPILPQSSYESTRFRSVVLVKKIERNGLLVKVEKMDHGAVISTENLAHDALTGKVLLTRSNNEFNDPIYSLELPAYWRYDGMGPAYLNLGAKATLTLDETGRGQFQNAGSLFVPGDELELRQGAAPVLRGWVVQVGPGSIVVVDRDGVPIHDEQAFQARILRSGRRNMQDVAMASIVAQDDPLTAFAGGAYRRVLQAAAVEFKDQWRKDCNCSDDGGENRYRDNRRGVWRQFRERTWLTDRTRTWTDDNTNIRHDGVYGTFRPFHRLENGHWTSDERGWTVVREVTDYSVRSQALEEQDALGLYSSATFAHGGRLPNSVARNAKYQEVGFESFEDEDNCADRHFAFTEGVFTASEQAAHSGRKSLRVAPTNEASMTLTLRECTRPRCGFELEATDVGSNEWEIQAVGDSGPYVFSQPSFATGQAIVQLMSDGLHFTGVTPEWTAQVVVTDGVGCVQRVQFGEEVSP